MKYTLIFYLFYQLFQSYVQCKIYKQKYSKDKFLYFLKISFMMIKIILLIILVSK